MRIKGWRCDVCGTEMGFRTYQYWIRRPRIRRGYPGIEMEPYDICEDCFVKLLFILHGNKEG